MLLSVIMPCYNESATLPTILARVRAVDIPKEIIAVDDHSSDNTYEILCAEAAADPSMTVIRPSAGALPSARSLSRSWMM